jgi:hypothetical protein
MSNKPLSEDKRALPFGSSFAIQDETTLEVLKNYQPDLVQTFSDNSLVESFCQRYRTWILESKLNKYQGIEDFKYAVYSSGTSESFDKFYIKNNTRRFRCFRAEYIYHQIAWRHSWPAWKFIEDVPLAKNDAVIISFPFSDTGNKHDGYDATMEECSRLGIPVLIDCAYANIAGGLEFNFNHECITDIVFSLSKMFPVAHARIGLRLTRKDDDDTLFVYQKISYNNRVGADLGNTFIGQFDPDYIVNKYRSKQIEFCSRLGVEASNSVLFGIGGKEWSIYNRGGKTNRLSFHKFLNQEIDILTVKEQ